MDLPEDTPPPLTPTPILDSPTLTCAEVFAKNQCTLRKRDDARPVVMKKPTVPRALKDHHEVKVGVKGRGTEGPGPSERRDDEKSTDL
jgi:hypothetical protein